MRSRHMMGLGFVGLPLGSLLLGYGMREDLIFPFGLGIVLATIGAVLLVAGIERDRRRRRNLRSPRK